MEEINFNTKYGGARISDLFVVTAVAAGFAAHGMLGFIALSFTFLAVWNRPLYFRFWACGMLGFGTGVMLAGVYGLQFYGMQQAELVGWGSGLVVGTIATITMFLGPLSIRSVEEKQRV